MKMWKYPIQVGRNEVEMPGGAVVRHLQKQGGVLCCWTEVATESPLVQTTIYVVGTGHDVPLHCRYVSTCLDGDFAWHLYQQVSATNREMSHAS